LKRAKFSDQDNRLQNWFQPRSLSLKTKLQALTDCDGLGTGGQLLSFALATIALFSRRPSLLTHAQFYAEDGMFWFSQAYNLGWLHSLLLPQAGYFNTMPRLAAGLALLVPLERAPLVMAIVGLLVQALPVPIVLSPRMRNWAALPTRLLLAAVYVAMPNTREILIVATNTQWHLALAALLLALASSPRTWLGRLFDVAVVLAAAFSGPFCILLAPIALIFWWLRRQRWSLVISILVSLVACIQIGLLLHNTVRVHTVLGVRLDPLLRMVGGNIVAGALFGSYAFASKLPMLQLVAAAIMGMSVYFYCLRFANLEWKLFLIYCVALFAASLSSPLIGGSKPLWDLLVGAVSARYWFFPMLAFVWSAVWCVMYGRDRLFKIAGACIVLCMTFGVVHDWKYRALTDDHFVESVQRMRDAKPGDHVVFPIVPEGWMMELVKKGSQGTAGAAPPSAQ
jgi:hypothetical protein